MGFSVNINETYAFPIIILKDESNDCEAEVYSLGAILNAFSVETAKGKMNIIDGFTSPSDAIKNITNGFKSAKLSPFVCRMQKGEYSFNNLLYNIDKFYLGDAAIHGLLFDASFNIKASGANKEKAFITLEYDYNKKEEGFPFAFSMEITYT
jgi:aldose 1-epimerase